MVFRYEPQKDYYIFYEDIDKWHLKEVTIPVGTFILDFLSLDMHNLMKTLLNMQDDVLNYKYNKVSSYLPHIKNHYLLFLILDDLTDIMYRLKSEKSGVSFGSVLESATSSFTGLQMDITQFLLTGIFENGDYVDLLLSGTFEMKINFYMHENRSGLYAQYNTKKLFSFMSLELINVCVHSIIIKQCVNCKQFFIPQKRSDEIYCDTIFKNGKTCKQIGYSIKEQHDPFKKEFAKARKTQHARIRYNKHIEDYKEKHYQPWLIAAQNAKKEYEASNDFEGFCKWLKDHKNSF